MNIKNLVDGILGAENHLELQPGTEKITGFDLKQNDQANKLTFGTKYKMLTVSTENK